MARQARGRGHDPVPAAAGRRHAVPPLLRGYGGAGRPAGVREPRHLPPDQKAGPVRPAAPAGVRRRPVLRRHRHRGSGGPRVRRGPARPAPAPGPRPAGVRARGADPCDLRRRAGQPGHQHADPAAGPPQRAGRPSCCTGGTRPRWATRAACTRSFRWACSSRRAEQPWNRQHDFSLWRCMVREFAEELGGALGGLRQRPRAGRLRFLAVRTGSWPTPWAPARSASGAWGSAPTR